MRSEGGRGGWGFRVSHPCDRKKSQGWGTGHFIGERASRIAGPSDSAQDDKLFEVEVREVRP